MTTRELELWEAYRAEELAKALPLLVRLGFSIDEEQVHIGGERHLMVGMQDVGTGGRKLTLLGRRTSDNRRVVIKVSSDRKGKEEIERERTCREVLRELTFSYRAFSTPEELVYRREGDFLISVVSYIAQDSTFLSRPLDEQFFLALKALETQEGVHATTYAHANTIRSIFGMAAAEEYIDGFNTFAKRARADDPSNKTLSDLLAEATAFLAEHRTTVERYSGFLTHADFVPHNLRIAENELYLLDYASVHFGNKYESWARFINFMTLYNPALERALMEYVRKNREADEYLSLRLMRIYKLGFLLQFYARSLHMTQGALQELTRERIHLWTQALRALLDDTFLPEERVRKHHEELERLRSPEEKQRQKELH